MALIDAMSTVRFPVVARRLEDLGPLRQQVQQRCPDLNPHLWPLDKLDQLRQWHPLGRDVPRLSSLAMGRDQPRAVLAIPEEQVVLLFVGRLELLAKAHPVVLLQALALVNDLAGQSPSDYQHALAWLAKIGAMELPQ